VIHRDDLRYTDDVIATLQSNNPLWYIANALNIDIADVKYHYAEVMTMSHNGKVLPLRTDDSNINSFLVYRWGYTTKRAIMGTRYRTDWPTDPQWYAERTALEIAKQFGLAVTTVFHHVQRNRLKLLRSYRFVDWPTDPQFYAERTTIEIAKILNSQIDTVRAHCKKNGYTFKQFRKNIKWPEDPQWYAERTRQEIADELDITYNAVSRHVWTFRIKCKKDAKATK